MRAISQTSADRGPCSRTKEENGFTGLDIRDTSFITSLKMTAAGVMKFLLVDEKDKPQQSRL